MVPGHHRMEMKMSDTDATTEETSTDTSVDDTTDQSAQTETDDVDYKAKYEETLAHSRKHETRAKENAAAAKELAEIKKSRMSDDEKRAASEKAIAERAEAAERKAALLQAAFDHSLTKDDLELLDGVPADKIDERAKKLAERLKKAAPPDASGREAGGARGPKKATSLDSAVAAHYA